MLDYCFDIIDQPRLPIALPPSVSTIDYCLGSHVDALMYYIGDLAMLRDTRFLD